jgi:hypothetical protein
MKKKYTEVFLEMKPTERAYDTLVQWHTTEGLTLPNIDSWSFLSYEERKDFRLTMSNENLAIMHTINVICIL